jgi:hypothetical protein
VQSLILLDFRTVVVCAALVATSEVVLAQATPAAGGSVVTVSCSSHSGERQVSPAATSAGVEKVMTVSRHSQCSSERPK